MGRHHHRQPVSPEEQEQFVAANRLCGELTSDVGELIDTGYHVRVLCWCGAVFARWVTPDAADRDLLRSRLLAFPY
jgi:hypothetical protein